MRRCDRVFSWLTVEVCTYHGARAYTRGGLGVNPPPWAWYFTKFYYLREGD